MTEKDIIDAYVKIRTIDNTIPDDVLDFMKQCALEKLQEFSVEVVNKVIDNETLQCGFNSHRLNENDTYHEKEIDFVKQINKEMKHNSSFLAQIVGDPNKKGWLSENETSTVLSVIQWLGTPVGQGFLERCK